MLRITTILPRHWGYPVIPNLFLLSECRALYATPGRIRGILRSSLILGAKRNTTRAFAGSLRPASSGMQISNVFCEFAGRQPPQVQTDTAPFRSNIFRPGRILAPYIAHLTKAAIPAKQPMVWTRPDIRSVVRGLANALDLLRRFDNFLCSDDLLRLIRMAELTTEIGRPAFFLSSSVRPRPKPSV